MNDSLNRNYSSLMKTENMKSNQVREIENISVIYQEIFTMNCLLSYRTTVLYCSQNCALLFLLKDGYDSDDFMWEGNTRQEAQYPSLLKSALRIVFYCLWILSCWMDSENNNVNLSLSTPTSWRCCCCQATMKNKYISTDANSWY